ncbi:MAG: tryptophan-rich sensory protein [Terriglobales bacterium]
MPKRRQYRWWEGLLFYAAVQTTALGIRSLVRRTRSAPRRSADRVLYRRQRLPWFAPPAAAFPIAWTINSVCATAGGLHVLNGSPHRPGTREFLRYQAAAWALYAVFTTAHFELDSPLNGAAVTAAYTVATAASIRAAWRMKDRAAVISLLPTAAWLALANPLALQVAVSNPDRFWHTPALADRVGRVQRMSGAERVIR